jgi:hypothetical protein
MRARRAEGGGQRALGLVEIVGANRVFALLHNQEYREVSR